MFKKPQKKNLRQRLDDDIEPEERMEVDDSFSVNEIKKEKKKKKKEKQESENKSKSNNALLSFDDLHEEEDGEVFQVKKSSQSKRLARQLDKERRKRKELEKRGLTSTTNVKEEKDLPPEPIKKPEKDRILILNGREAEFAKERSDTDEDGEDENPRFHRPKHLRQVLESGCIPDAAMIHAARKSRQKARELGTDYIPVGSDDTNEKNGQEHDDDEDGSDEGEGEGSNENQRIDFTVDTTAKEQERRREAFFAAQDDEKGQEESDQEDDDMENWETQQIRKAVSGAQLAAAQQEMYNQTSYVGKYHYVGNLATPPAPIINEPDAIQVLAEMPAKIEAPTVEELTKLLRDRLSSLKETQRRHILDRERAQAELLEIGIESVNIKEGEPERSRKFQFYQDLRGYVTDLVECFNEKMPLIEQLEQRTIAVFSKKTTNIVQRRRLDTKDQAAEAIALTKSAGTLIEQDDARERRATEREGRRARRRRGRETSEGNKHYEGLSSDDEQTDLELSSQKTQLEQLDRDSKLLMNDVIEDFNTLPLVMQRFEKWKNKYSDAYKEAYIHLSLPKVFSPLIRLSIMTWNPLEENCELLENYHWFKILTTYCLNPGESEQDLSKDPDVNLIPLVIEMSVLPKLSKLIVEAWDPCSTTQTKRLYDILCYILTEYPQLAPRGRMSKSLLPVLADKIRDSIDNDIFIPIYPAKTIAILSIFFQRQFWSAYKLLRNILQFRGILGDSTLQEFALAALLGRYLLSALRTCDHMDALDKSRHILALIPKYWLSKEPPFIQIQLFQNLIINIVKAIDGSSPGGRDALIDALTVLRTLGAKTKADELSRIYL